MSKADEARAKNELKRLVRFARALLRGIEGHGIVITKCAVAVGYGDPTVFLIDGPQNLESVVRGILNASDALTYDAAEIRYNLIDRTTYDQREMYFRAPNGIVLDCEAYSYCNSPPYDDARWVRYIPTESK